MLYQQFFRRLLLALPILLLLGSLALLIYALWTHNDHLLTSAIDGLTIYTPSSAVIFWGMVYELDDSKEIMEIQAERNKKAAGQTARTL